MSDQQKKAAKPEIPVALQEPSEMDANVDMFGNCEFTDTAEQIRPDGGAPCHDGRDGK